MLYTVPQKDLDKVLCSFHDSIITQNLQPKKENTQEKTAEHTHL